MAILCCRVCKSTPIIFISASFVPSNLWLEHHHLTRRVVRPTSLCHQTGRFLIFSTLCAGAIHCVSVNVPPVPDFRIVVYCPGQSVGKRLQRIVQQPDEGGVCGPGNFRLIVGGQSFGSGVSTVLESGAVTQRDRVPDAGRIRRRTWAGLRFAPSAPSSINTTTDSHKHWYIKGGQDNPRSHQQFGERSAHRKDHL